MKPTVVIIVFLLALFVSVVASLGLNASASTEPDNSFPQLSMPVEHINYTVTEINGALWAKVDGEYSIRLSQPAATLPLVYPMPPNSTNIHLYLNDKELCWSNYTQAYPEALHKTAIGDWWMIDGMLENISDNFALRIHYEHPIEKVNGSSVFLYDLNIADYLSEANPYSTAYFTILFETNVTSLQVYTAPPQNVATEWQSKDFTVTKDGSTTVVTVEMQSHYGEALPGDLAIVFTDAAGKQNSSEVGEAPVWAVPVLLDVALVLVLVYVKRKTLVSRFSSRGTANSAGI